jgi:hypothetical protein
VRRLLHLIIAGTVGVFALHGCYEQPIGPDASPVADAGADQTVTDFDGTGAENVTLDGSASIDPDGTIASWVWTDAGAEIATGEKPSAILPVGAHAIRLTVTDADGNTAVDEVLVRVLAVVGPIADAGPDQTVVDANGDGTESVTLDGSGSRDPVSSISSYVWRENGNQIATGATPNVTLGVGSHTITLSITNQLGDSDTDDVFVTVVPAGENPPPVADAGPDQTKTDENGDGRERLTLDGSGSSDPNGTIVSYVWTEGGTEIATGGAPRVRFDVGTHDVTLTVTDNDGATDTDTVVITVIAGAGNQPPTADAGPDQAVTDTDGGGDESVMLNGSGSSDPDGIIASYVWTEGGSEIATGATPAVTLAVGTHDITLTVTDNDGAPDSDTVVITIDAGGGSISYAADIQPYFNGNCISCHMDGGPKGVDLDSYESLLAGGDSGPLVVPGNSTEGILLPKLRDGHKGAPHGTTIIEDLEVWIDAGALDN